MPPTLRTLDMGNLKFSDAVLQDEHAIAEPALLEQFQVQPHAVRKEALSAADDRGTDDRLQRRYRARRRL